MSIATMEIALICKPSHNYFLCCLCCLLTKKIHWILWHVFSYAPVFLFKKKKTKKNNNKNAFQTPFLFLQITVIDWNNQNKMMGQPPSRRQHLFGYVSCHFVFVLEMFCYSDSMFFVVFVVVVVARHSIDFMSTVIVYP